MTPRSCLRWKPTGKIFNIVGLRWVPTGKIFTSSTTKVDSEPTNGLNEDITNQYECEQTLDVSVGTLNLSAGLTPQRQETSVDNNTSGLVLQRQKASDYDDSGPVPQLQNVSPLANTTAPPKQEFDLLFGPLYDEFFNAAWEKHYLESFYAQQMAHDMEILIKTCLMPFSLKTQNDSFTFVHELKKEMCANLKYVESLENAIDELESDKAEFSNMYDILLQECVSSDVMCSYLHLLSDLDAHNELQCVYLRKVKECESQLQDKNIAISELKKLIEKCKGKYVETKFDKLSVVRQLNAQRILKASVLGKPTLFSDSLERKSFSKTKSVPKTNVSDGLSKLVTTQILPQTARQATFRNTNPRVSTSIGVIHRTNVSRPQLRSTQMKDKVVRNNSQVKFKKTKVEDHPTISSISNKIKSVTVCNDISKSKTSNVNDVCATCGKCVFNSNHDACVSKFLNDVNAKTKKPKVVPISTRKPKSQANKSIATPPKKIVASESTI
ncbi:hypothetical protein Tco_0944438 [Tanacetum coccineum]